MYTMYARVLPPNADIVEGGRHPNSGRRDQCRYKIFILEPCRRTQGNVAVETCRTPQRSEQVRYNDR